MAVLGPRRGWASSAVLALILAPGCRDGGRQKTGPAPAATTDTKPVSASSAAPSSKPAFYADRFAKRPQVSALTDLGRRLFFDSELSASRKMACSTCHDPRFAYGPPNELSVQLGGADERSPGVRAVPSLRYLQTLPRFEEHHFDEAVDESVDQGPTGGHGWDGRVDSTHDQARLPLTSPFEMANESVEAVARKVRDRPYAEEFRAAFGDDVFADSERASVAILWSLEVFQQSPKEFSPFDSRYDQWLRHKVELEPRELHGLSLFNDAKKGNCASCHPSQIRHGAFPLLTDFGFAAIGVPRNRAIPSNQDPGFFDLGLCGPLRTDLSSHKEYCGQFRVPGLRNVTLRRAFFHNGVFHRLREVLEFYAQRDTNPGRFYPGTHGKPNMFDDVPPEYRGNVNREPPFGKKPGAAPALTSADIDDLVAFLATLTDADMANPAP